MKYPGADGVCRGMELFTAVILAGPLGYLAPSRRAGLALYLLAWALILPVQLVALGGLEPGDPAVNALILALGVACVLLGARMGERRRNGLVAH